ncbi:CBS domain-containing protein [Candidatus Latescibacterota bacterium]
MKIDSILTNRVVTVEMDDTLSTIREIFVRLKFHHVLVVENQKLVGVISDRDLLKSISPFIGTLSERTLDLNTLNRRAHQIMSYKLITVTRENSIEEAARKLLEHKVSCLPVVSEKGYVEGILTWKDIFRGYMEDVGSDYNTDDR